MSWQFYELENRDRRRAGTSTEGDRDPCHDGICQFPQTLPWFCSLLPTSAEGFSFMGFLCSTALYRLWYCLTVSDPDLVGFQSIIKEWVSVRSLLPRMSYPVEVVNGKRSPLSEAIVAWNKEREDQRIANGLTTETEKTDFLADRGVGCIEISFVWFFSFFFFLPCWKTTKMKHLI